MLMGILIAPSVLIYDDAMSHMTAWEHRSTVHNAQCRTWPDHAVQQFVFAHSFAPASMSKRSLP